MPNAGDELGQLTGVLREVAELSPFATRRASRLLAISRIVAGEPAALVAAEYRFQRTRLEREAVLVRRGGLAALLSHLAGDAAHDQLLRRRQGIAQILLGTLAERRFEVFAREMTGGRDLRIEDHRRSRTDTDYRVLNGGGDPVFRLNIKFHGALFKQARDTVGLEPEDCFALATYKIHNALLRQEKDVLPYMFVVLSVRDLNAGTVAEFVPERYAWALDVLEGDRVFEEAIVGALVHEDYEQRFRAVLDRMPAGEFRVISAAKAAKLMHEKLFQRVFALRQRGFTRAYRNAEIDMHLSLSTEMTPMARFFELVREESLQVVAVKLYRGDL